MDIKIQEIDIAKLDPNAKYIIALEMSEWSNKMAKNLEESLHEMGVDNFALIGVNGLDSFKFVKIPKKVE